MKFSKLFATALVAVALVAQQAAANVLVNGGFETDAVLNAPPVGGATGWATFGPAAGTASANLDPVQAGIGSLRLGGNGNFSVPGASQTFAASPGELWNFEGYMLSQTALPTTATFGLLKIVWSNGVNDLAPGPITVGQAGPAANPGVESLPFLNSASTPNTWQFTQAQGYAPAGTTQVKFFALFVDQSPGVGYFDSLNATRIPEPTSLALLGLAMIGGMTLIRRR